MSTYLFSDKQKKSGKHQSYIFIFSLSFLCFFCLFKTGALNKIHANYLFYHSKYVQGKTTEQEVLQAKIDYLQSQLTLAQKTYQRRSKPHWPIELADVDLINIHLDQGVLRYQVSDCRECVLMNASGLIGFSDHFQSQNMVKPITDSSIMLPVIVRGSGNNALVQGQGRKKLLAVHELDGMGKLQVGDNLLTSGIGGLFPKGIPVARVVEKSQNYDGESMILAEPFFWHANVQNLFTTHTVK